MTSELARRIGFTVAALLVYRLGSHIPLPGLNPSDVAAILRAPATGIFSTFDLFAGGKAWRFSIFALGILPYVTAAILIQLLTFFTPGLRTLRQSGERGRRKIIDLGAPIQEYSHIKLGSRLQCA